MFGVIKFYQILAMDTEEFSQFCENETTYEDFENTELEPKIEYSSYFIDIEKYADLAKNAHYSACAKIRIALKSIFLNPEEVKIKIKNIIEEYFV